MKNWFITGASRGLGLEMARAALAQGDRVVATGRDSKKIASALEGFNEDHFLSLELDVTDADSIFAAVNEAIQHFGRIDVLVNNAGYGLLGAFEELSETAIERQFATNVFGVFAVTRGVLPIMRAQHSGHIINISSVAGIEGYDGSSIYCATKFAMSGWSESLSYELDRFGIKVTCVYPGRFRTDFLDRSSVAHADSPIQDYAEIRTARTQALDEANHTQAGNPAAFGQAIVELANLDNPPKWFGAGSDAVQIMFKKAESLQSNTEQWRKLSVSTDFKE